MSLPLENIRVLDLTRALAGPFCTMCLADFGADVIKVESLPKGDMTRHWAPFHGDSDIAAYYLSINRNKRDLAVNFRDPKGLEVLRRLAEFGLSPLAVKVQGPGAARGAIELRTDPLPEARMQRIARGLLAAAGARRISYRGTGGMGGVLVKPVEPASAPPAERLVAA